MSEDRHSRIFSDLANPVRLHMLTLLEKNPMRIAGLAKTVGFTIQAIQRHIERLESSGLIIRGSDGALHLSSIGMAVLVQLPLFEFLAKHKDYFQDHTLEGVPKHLMCSLGDLNNCELITDPMEVWQRAKNFVENSGEFLYGVTSVQPIEFYDTARTLLQNGVKCRMVLADGMLVAKGFEQKRKKNGWMDAIKKGHVEERFTSNLPIMVGVSDTAAQLMFANKKTGQIDSGAIFHSNDAMFRNWCMDLFNYYWDETKKSHSPKVQEV